MAARDEKGRVKPGQVLNPQGRPKESEEIRFLKKRVHNDIKKFGLQLMMKRFEDISDLLHDPSITGGERMILTCFEKAAVEGSKGHFELYCKTIGYNLNLPQTVDLNVETNETGLEEIPTDKLEKIQDILNSDS